MPREFRPMGVGDILDGMFRLYRHHLGRFMIIALAVYVPYSLIHGTFQVSVNALVLAGNVVRPDDIGVVFTYTSVYLFLTLIFNTICAGALVHNISAAYLGRELGSWESYVRAGPRLIRLLLVQFIAGLIYTVGLFCCVVPGIILAIWFMPLAPVVMLENRGVLESLQRSRHLMSGNLAKGFLLGLAVFLLTLVLSLDVLAVSAWIPWPSEFAGAVFEAILQAFIIPVQVAPSILLYYDLRIRKEGFDLQQLAAMLGGKQPE